MTNTSAETGNLVSRLRAIPEGTKLTITVENHFGALVERKVTTCGKVRHHGYFSHGGWSFYRINDHDEACHEILVRPYRKRQIGWVKIGYTIRDYRLGWDT